MPSDIDTIKQLANNGASAEYIAEGLGLEVSYVKTVLKRGIELTDDERAEVTGRILDMAMGRVHRAPAEVQLTALTYLDRKYEERERIRGNANTNTETIELLRLRGRDRMNEVLGINAQPVQEAEVVSTKSL